MIHREQWDEAIYAHVEAGLEDSLETEGICPDGIGQFVNVCVSELVADGSIKGDEITSCTRAMYLGLTLGVRAGREDERKGGSDVGPTETS